MRNPFFKDHAWARSENSPFHAHHQQEVGLHNYLVSNFETKFLVLQLPKFLALDPSDCRQLPSTPPKILWWYVGCCVAR